MSRFMRALLVLLVVGLAAGAPFVQAAGGPPSGDGSGEHKAEARIYAAASLTDVVGVIAKQFEPIRGSQVVAVYGASNTLAQQLHEGAPPGVFISASAEWVDKLDGWGLVEA
jgi:ABC-type molybdate transport system substrate-binding protein